MAKKKANLFRLQWEETYHLLEELLHVDGEVLGGLGVVTLGVRLREDVEHR